MSSWPNRAWVGITVSERQPGLKRGWPVREGSRLRGFHRCVVHRLLFASLLFHQRAVALIDRPERLFGRDRRADLVVVPRVLGLERLLHPDQKPRMDLSTVG